MASTLTLLRYTPFSDVLRFRLTGRLNWRQRIDAAGLPQSIKDVILRVTQQTRLWQSERMDVAGELIAHFIDGLASGESSESLIKTFGDPKQAARLIGRGKIRNRPLLWHGWRLFYRAIGVLFVFYVGMAIYFNVGHPTIKVNYVDEMNRAPLGAPEADRAWPLYREGLLKVHDSNGEWPKVSGYRFDGPRKAELVAWLNQNTEALEIFRSASDKPEMGFIYGRTGSARDPQLWPQRSAATQPVTEDTHELIAVLLPHLHELRLIAFALRNDALLAADANDSKRALSDVRCMERIVKQLEQDDTCLVSGLVVLAIRADMVDALGRVIATHHDLLDDAPCRDLAHELAGPQVAADVISLRSEQNFMLDLLQRCYTDDGHGDGRLTPDGLRYLRMISYTGVSGPSSDEADIAVPVAGPLMLSIAASRKQVFELYTQIFDQANGNYHTPAREVIQPVAERFAVLHESLLESVRYVPVAMLSPALDRPQRTAELYLGKRDGLLVGMALEVYHRRHNAYPENLSQLTPDLLPSVPADRITGEPLKYRLIDGKPLVYSVGFDRVDDGGRIDDPKNPDRSAEWKPGSTKTKGDWVLYPPPQTPVEENE